MLNISRLWSADKSKLIFFLLILITFVGALLRLLALSQTPSVLHRDETSIGYNAYSLVQTGKDEHGEAWPINFKAFGDYKLPGLIYLTTISVKFLGLTATAVRLPTAIATVFTIPTVFWLTREMGWSQRVALLASALLTFSFWHISQARNAYEPIVGLLFSTLTWASWLAGWRKPVFWIASTIAFAAAALTYNVPLLLLPPLIIISWWLLKQQQPASTKSIPTTHNLTITIVLLFWIIAGGITALNWSVNASRSNTTIFLHTELIEQSKQAVHGALITGLPSLLARTINHPILDSMMQIGQGYVSAFDLTYLFFLGDKNPWHNVQNIGFGNLNPALLLPLLLGIYALWKKRHKIESQLLVVYVLLSPLPSAITVDAPITNRLLDFHLAIILIAAIGINHLLVVLKKHRRRWQYVFGITFSATYAILLSIFLLRYFFTFNATMKQFWNPGVNKMVTYAENSQNQYTTVFIDDLDLAYSYFSFYARFDPSNFQSKAKWTENGFTQVATYQNYHFTGEPQWLNVNKDEFKSWFPNETSKILIIKKGEPKTSEVESDSLVWKLRNYRSQWLWHARVINKSQASKLIRFQNN